jgi:transcriptional regulator with XRE-family HTH domain
MAAPIQSPAHAAFGRAVRELRARRGMSQEQLAIAADIHRNYVGAIERGEINVTFKNLLKLRDGLGIELTELILVYERQASEPVSHRRRRRRPAR